MTKQLPRTPDRSATPLQNPPSIRDSRAAARLNARRARIYLPEEQRIERTARYVSHHPNELVITGLSLSIFTSPLPIPHAETDFAQLRLSDWDDLFTTSNNALAQIPTNLRRFFEQINNPHSVLHAETNFNIDTWLSNIFANLAQSLPFETLDLQQIDAIYAAIREILHSNNLDSFHILQNIESARRSRPGLDR